MAYYKRKWKPKAFDLEKLEQVNNDFANKINEIRQQYNLPITINKNSNSIYFTYHEQQYRISTHHSYLEDIYQPIKHNGGGYTLPQINIVTNSKNNIIKKLLEVLET